MLKELVKRCSPLPSGSRLLILGGGFTGQHVASLARKLGTEVICSRRKASHNANIVFDSKATVLPPNEAFEGITHLLSCIPPTNSGEDPVIKILGNQMIKMPLQWVGYLSTTGVYGNCKGEWVTEADPAKPTQPRSQRRLACEQAWQESGLPVQILRLPGIYGPGRSALETINKGEGKMIEKENQVFSRIHVDDIAGAIMHLINLAENGKKPLIINVADNIPSANTEVLKYAANLLGKQLPPIIKFEIAAKDMSPMALSFWQENRRISNKLLCENLGYQLIHPDYRSGLKDCWLQYKI